MKKLYLFIFLVLGTLTLCTSQVMGQSIKANAVNPGSASVNLGSSTSANLPGMGIGEIPFSVASSILNIAASNSYFTYYQLLSGFRAGLVKIEKVGDSYFVHVSNGGGNILIIEVIY